MYARARNALTISAVIAAGVHLFPFRTEKLSPPAPMVLGGQPPGRVGRRRINFAKPALGRLRSFRSKCSAFAPTGSVQSATLRPDGGGGAAKPRLGRTLNRLIAVKGCLACDLAEGRLPLPGGVIHETANWFVEHTVGPLALGTLILKPKRHVTRVSGLSNEEATSSDRSSYDPLRSLMTWSSPTRSTPVSGRTRAGLRFTSTTSSSRRRAN